MGVREARLPSDSRLYVRGELDQPGETVRARLPAGADDEAARHPPASSGRRELADWIASKDNPLTARVMANRVWLHLIGRGLVPTPDNFGASGQPPSNPALLDHLAVSFADDGWSVKKLIRTIVLSRAYQLSSQFDDKNFEADPDNVLVWRMPKRRLEAEALRDTMLALSGRLDLDAAEGQLGRARRRGERFAAFRFGGDPTATDTHRTVYLPIVRDQVPEVLTLFDFPDPSLIIGERATTTVPAQSLYLMNNPFVIRQAGGPGRQAARRRRRRRRRLTRAYQLATRGRRRRRRSRRPRSSSRDYGKDQTSRATWTALCQALFASAEFVTAE